MESCRNIFALSSERLRRLELACDHEHDIIGLVIFVITPAGSDGHAFNIAAVADGRLAVVVKFVGGAEMRSINTFEGEFSPRSNSLRTTVISESRSDLRIKLFTSRSASHAQEKL